MKYFIGFTIVELLIAVAIVSILSVLSINGYQNSLEKSNFRMMRDVASKLALSQQQHRQTFGQYASQLASSGNPSSATLILPELDEYNVSVSGAGFQGFTANFSPKSSGMKMPEQCQFLRVSSLQGFLKYDSFNSASSNTTMECLPNG